MIDHTLNKAQLDKIFEENAIYLGGDSVIPEYRAAELFEEAVINFASGWKENYKMTGGFKSFRYIGLIDMVTLHNIRMVKREMKKQQK